jgi:hypothetical protein
MHALAPGSPAASHVTLADCAPLDQRHVARPLPANADACDVRAFEAPR